MYVAEGNATTKNAQVCQACKRRHRKCEWEGDACLQCKHAGIECRRQPTLRFRHHPQQKALENAPPQFAPMQVPLQFYDETPGLLALYEDETAPEETCPVSTTPRSIVDMPSVAADSVGSSHGVYQDSSNSTPSGFATGGLSSLTPIEALLVRNFTDRMAQWTDIADSFRTFELEVSRLALTDPIIRYAICAFSARHYYRLQTDEDGEGQALDFQNQCLNLLIPATSGSQPITESVLTAVSLLRQNEEMDEQDYRFHLEGASHILNMVPQFASAGGIGEAACWLCLREDIYVSLTTQTPIKIGLDCFSSSAWIRRGDDQSWASKSVLQLAFLLNQAFREQRDLSVLAASKAELAEWNASKPISYEPILFQPRSRTEGRCFPNIWMLAPYHALGLQYFHIAQIVLSAVGPEDVVYPYDYVAAAKARARQIRHHLYMVLGLAMSNERAENTWFTARHCLSVWGSYLQHKDDQTAVLRFLERFAQRSGWKDSQLVESLNQCWNKSLDED